MLNACTMLFRGAGYAPFTDGNAPAQAIHAAIAAPYAHVTAPLRRLVDIDDVGALAAFLASDAARNITGSTLYVDAGFHTLG